jgi:hypothetical protein
VFRPSRVTFAAVMLFVAGGLHLLLAIAEFTTVGLITVLVPSPSFGPHWLRGLLDLAFVAAFCYAGFQVWHRRRLGRIQGMVIAAAGVLRWALHIPVSPVLSAIGIILALVIIVTLWTQAEYFRSNA